MAAQQSAPVESWRDVIRRKNTHLLFSEDLGPPGTKVDVEIVNSGRTSVTGQDGKKSEKVWLEFRGKKKKLAIGATIAKTLDSIFGTDNHYAWRGWITLVVLRIKVTDMDTGARLEQNAIRVAPDQPKGKRSGPPVPPSEPPTPSDGGLSDEEKRAIEAAELKGVEP
jgi:hypothetical protein